MDTPSWLCPTPVGAQHPHTQLGALQLTLPVLRLGLFPLKSSLVLCGGVGAVFEFGVEVRVWEQGPPLSPWAQAAAAVAAGTGWVSCAVPLVSHPRVPSAARALWPGRGGGGGSPGHPGHPGTVSQPSAVSAALAWTNATI